MQMEDLMNEETELSLAEQKALLDIRALKALTESPGWAIVRRVLQGQIEAIKNQIVFSPRGSQRTEFEYEFLKGQAAGLQIAINLAEQQYETERDVAEALNGRRANTSDDDE
jgi:Tfp pilus assembly PilM family ATPase